MDYGFEAAGFETAVALEFDHDCCETLRRNRSWCVIERSIFDVPSDEILRRAGLRKEEADLVIGGPPCQPFSKSGYWASGDSKRLDDPRADTLAAYMRVIEDVLPQAFVLENVEGLAFSGKDEGMTLLLEHIKRINRKTKSNYCPVWKVLNAADHGVPQIRERVFLIAARDGTLFSFPQPSFAPLPDAPVLGMDLGLRAHRTAWDALGDLLAVPVDDDLGLRGKWAGLLASIPEGNIYLFHTERGGGMPLFGWRRRYWTFLLKLAKNRPSWTIQAQPGPAVGPFHWNSRRLSIPELCRLQTFPDDVTIVGSRGSAQRQIGNAVPSLLGEVLGREIRVQLLGERRPRHALRLLPPDRSPAPPPERPRPVPREYRHLAGEHSAHPGTGKGFGAHARLDPTA